MAKPFTHTKYVPRNTSPWGLGIPADAVLIHGNDSGKLYGWREEPVTLPRFDDRELHAYLAADTISLPSAPPPAEVQQQPRITVSWDPDPEPKPDFFAQYVCEAMEKRIQTIDRFLIATFAITEEEQAVVKEVLAGKDISTIYVSGRGHGKTRRAWAWQRLMKRLHEDPLPNWFWPNVHAYRMLEDNLGRDIVNTLTKDRT